MVFSSVSFLFIFLPVVMTGYILIGKRARNLFLLLASMLFYTWGEREYVLALLVCIIVNYSFGALICMYRDFNVHGRLKIAKLLLITGVCFNILFLVYFKYTNFLIDNLNMLASMFSLEEVKNDPIHLPLGISFFVFQALSYIIDVYRRQVSATYNPINFAVYKSLFPQLIAGPIVRYRDIADQVTKRTITSESFAFGARRFTVGLGKKVLIANTVGATVDQIFAIPVTQLGPGVAWLGVVCYTLQIYFDFSGYSDMAIGLGQMLGFKFLENFNYPYISRSIREFWGRWHISLSTWFRDYLYIPLGGNQKGPWRTYLNLLLVFLLCGMWHGASWTFLVWGLWHGSFLVLERLKLGKVLERLPAPAGHVYTLLVVMIGWVLFRSPDLAYAADYLGAMFHPGKGGVTLYHVSTFTSPELLLAIAAGVICSAPLPELLRHFGYALLSSGRVPARLMAISLPVLNLFYMVFILFSACMILAGGTYNPFIYFRF